MFFKKYIFIKNKRRKEEREEEREREGVGKREEEREGEGKGPWEHVATGKKHLTLGGPVSLSGGWCLSDSHCEVRVSQ